MRLRTLPLSLAGVILGSLLAIGDYRVDPAVLPFLYLTTVCLQILSNMSNELGDVLHGTDNDDRQGPRYGLNSGALTVTEMKRLIGLFVVICCICGLVMIRISFGTLLSLEAICLMLLGAAAIMGAMKYTLGRNPYGYRGFGDIFVFIFFGIVSVRGAYFVCAHTIPSWLMALPAASIGFFSVGVLNINNIRDMDTDATNRVTVAIRLGVHRSRIYQTILTVLGWVCIAAFFCCRFFDWVHFLFVLTLPLYVIDLKIVWTEEGRALDRALPILVMSTFALSLLAGLGYVLFLI